MIISKIIAGTVLGLLITLINIQKSESYILTNLPDGRIVGGVSTTIAQFPHQVSLRYQNFHRCGAIIIGQNLVLTAAHCVVSINKNQMIVRAGTTYKDYPGSDYRISRIIIHEKYNSKLQDHDIAIIIITDNFKYSSRIQPINLDENKSLKEISNSAVEEVGTLAFVSGWGALKESGSSPQALNYASVLIVSQSVCSKAYYPAKISESMICAGWSSGGRDSCQGDSGGPLIIVNGSVPTLIGIVSWGNGCARPDYPGVYSRVSAYRSWINQNVNL